MTLYNMTSSVLQNDPHLCCKTSLIVSTWNKKVSYHARPERTNEAYADLLPNLLINNDIDQGSRHRHSVLSGYQVFERY